MENEEKLRCKYIDWDDFFHPTICKLKADYKSALYDYLEKYDLMKYAPILNTIWDGCKLCDGCGFEPKSEKPAISTPSEEANTFTETLTKEEVLDILHNRTNDWVVQRIKYLEKELSEIKTLLSYKD